MTRRLFLFVSGLVLAGGAVGLTRCRSAPGLEPMPRRPDHHLTNGFRNPRGSPSNKISLSAGLAFLSRRAMESNGKITPPPGHALSPDEAVRRYRDLAGRETVTWLGHSSFLLRLAGLNVLLDPFLSDYASPAPPFGPKRYVPPAFKVDRLPPIDVLIVSHNHYDHLDRPTIEALAVKDRITVVVPLKLGAFFRRRGFGRVHELDWHDTLTIDGLKIITLPAIHFSRRGLGDANQTLWAGFALLTGRHKLYFSGDTGYGPVFAGLGREYGPFDLGLVTIGAYEPRALMRASHATPEEAVRIARDLGLKAMLGIHWGTVRLADEPPFEPGPRFVAAAAAAGYPEASVWRMPIGQTRELAG